jgi:DNA-binding transcriptional LysR family regulator
MNLIDLEAFVSVLDHGSIVAASAHLHLTQSAVTRRIQNLEDALGTPLLDRQTRPLQPTRAGQETYEFAKPVLSSVNDLRTGIMHGGEPSGDFRFGMSRSLGMSLLDHPSRAFVPTSPKYAFRHSYNGAACWWSVLPLAPWTALLCFCRRAACHQRPLCQSA